MSALGIDGSSVNASTTLKQPLLDAGGGGDGSDIKLGTGSAGTGSGSGVAVQSSSSSGAVVVPVSAFASVKSGYKNPYASIEKDAKTNNVIRRNTRGDIKPVVQLPACFKGASDLPPVQLLEGAISNVTLPSRLELLGRRGFKILAALNPKRIGNAVIGFAPVWNCCESIKCLGCNNADPDERGVRNQLFVLPSLFSRAHARIFLFLRVLALLLFSIFVVAYTNAVNVQVGRAWAIGTTISIFVMWRLSVLRRAPDGVMTFCRSMGVPEVEEFMFSYAWKTEKDNIRTLAKAMWDAGVGVWIDVVKLCPGDEIRPMVKTIVNRVHRVVVFLSKAYINSPNCCVEIQECVQHPDKIIICVLEDVDPAVLQFLRDLKPIAVVNGIEGLIPILDAATQDMSDIGAYDWWRSQRISGAGVPSNVVPASDWPVPTWTITGTIAMPDKSLDVGPWYLAGDCRSHGQRVSPPWLLMLAFIALASNFFDIYFKYTCKFDTPDECVKHSFLDYVFLALVGCCNIAPFFAWDTLWDTRRDIHVSLRPLLASRSLYGGVRVKIEGDLTDPVVVHLRGFLSDLGHLKTGSDPFPFVRVYVMNTKESRNRIFGPENAASFDRNALFVWSSSENPFDKGDPIAQQMMKYLVLVSGWEKTNLAENLFSAIGIRVVDLLHSGKNS